MRFGIVVFPGSNCDHDCYYALRLIGERVDYVWYDQEDLSRYDCVVLPGGFSYGDYLRAGAIARFAPVMKGIARHAKNGGLVLGICNGFQMLLEAGLLPGAMLANRNLKFICRHLYLKVEKDDSPFTLLAAEASVLELPIAHYRGNYYADKKTFAGLLKRGQVILRYCDADGQVTDEANPNGSLENVAGITNREGNVFGLMPHPERASDPLLGSTDGQILFRSIVASVKRKSKSDVLEGMSQ